MCLRYRDIDRIGASQTVRRRDIRRSLTQWPIKRHELDGRKRKYMANCSTS